MTRKLILPLIAAIALIVPIVYAINFIGAINYVGPHGGNVTFAENFTATSLTYGHNVNLFTNMVWGPRNQGTLGFDCDAGVNMTVTAITRDTITYTVTTAALGNVTTYVYYYRNIAANRLRAPDTITVGGAPPTFAAYVAGVTLVNSTGSPVVVVLDWADASVTPSITTDAGSLIQVFTLITICSIFMYIGGAKMGIDQEYLLGIIIVIAFLMIVGALATSWGL